VIDARHDLAATNGSYPGAMSSTNCAPSCTSIVDCGRRSGEISVTPASRASQRPAQKPETAGSRLAGECLRGYQLFLRALMPSQVLATIDQHGSALGAARHGLLGTSSISRRALANYPVEFEGQGPAIHFGGYPAPLRACRISRAEVDRELFHQSALRSLRRRGRPWHYHAEKRARPSTSGR